MKPRIFGAVAALVALPTAVAVLPGRLDAVTGATTSWSHATRPATAATSGGTATLIRVTVTTGTDSPSTVGRDAATAPGRRLGRASCTNPGPGTNAYNLSGSRVSGPTTAHLNPAGGPAGAASAFQAAFNTWKAADANAPSIGVASDGTASAPRADHTDEIMFKNLGGRTLAVTYTWKWSTGQYESDVAFGTNVPWFLAPSEGDGCYEGVAAYDLQNTATHEFGHVYGLDHVSSAFNTMAPTATKGETYKRSLAPGDAAGIRAIY